MHFLSSGAFILAVFLGFSQQCPAAGDQQSDEPKAVLSVSSGYKLHFSGSKLAARDNGNVLASWELPDAKPYCIVSQGSPKIVTTCNAQLDLSTIIASAAPISFTNMLPIHIKPGFAVLAELAVSDTTQNGAIALVDPHGKVVWRDSDGMLLQPHTGEMPEDYYMFALTPGSTPDLPMGEQPELVFVDATNSTEKWRVPLRSTNIPVDAQLLAAENDRCLLLLQYGFVNFEFVVLDIIDGIFLQSWTLDGQVGSQMVFPGGFSKLAPIELDAGKASVIVLNRQEAGQLWSFALEQLTLEQSSLDSPAFNLDENELPLGGIQIPDSSVPVFPQGILPTQAGNEWTILALVNDQGQVLVVDGAEARWLAPARIPDGG